MAYYPTVFGQRTTLVRLNADHGLVLAYSAEQKIDAWRVESVLDALFNATWLTCMFLVVRVFYEEKIAKR